MVKGLRAVAALALALGAPSAPARSASLAHIAPRACPDVRLSAALSPARRQAATEALADACVIIRSESFRARVLARVDWLAGCGRRGLGPRVPITGEALLEAFPDRISGFELRAEDVRGVALSDLPRGWTKVDTSRFDGWIGGGRRARAALVNTLVHEMSHHVPRLAGGATYAFTDRGNNRATCPRRRLVSYGLGQIAEGLWLEQHPATRDPGSPGKAAASSGAGAG